MIIDSELDSAVGPEAGALYRVDGAPGGSLEDAAVLLPTTSGRQFGVGLDSGADLTGDGIGDIVVSAWGTSSTRGQAWLVDGSAWVEAGSATVADVAVGHVSSSVPGTFGPSAVRLVGDVTGDGVQDIALGACCFDGAGVGTVGRVAIVSADAFGGTLDDADVVIEGPWEDAFFGYAVDRIGDQDGDGLPEVLVSATGGLVGAVVPGVASGAVDDLALTMLYGDVPDTSARATGDLDGDGAEDVAIVGAENVLSFYTAVGSAPVRTLDSPTFTFTWSEHSGVLDVLPLGDLDGDDRAEVLIPQAWSDSGTQRLWLLAGRDVHAGGTMDADAVTLTGVSAVPAALFGYSLALAGDVDGDGQDDVVVGAPQYSSGGHYAGGATLITVPR